MKHADPIQRLILAFSRLPSVGEKTAARFCFTSEPGLGMTEELSEALKALQQFTCSVRQLAHKILAASALVINEYDLKSVLLKMSALWQSRKQENIRAFIMCFMG